jgi:hypothetical protein
MFLPDEPQSWEYISTYAFHSNFLKEYHFPNIPAIARYRDSSGLLSVRPSMSSGTVMRLLKQ